MLPRAGGLRECVLEKDWGPSGQMPVLGDCSRCLAWPGWANSGGLVVTPVGSEWVVCSPVLRSPHLGGCHLEPPSPLA